MSLFEDTNPRALKDLLTEVDSRTMVLPEFQRSFVWDPMPTQELIVSIAYNYPAGSILRVRDSKRVFACREFEGARKLDGKKHTFLVLDGQQRLTSLYQAFYGVGEHRYYLDLNELLKGSDFEEAIYYLKASSRRAKQLEKFEIQEKDLVLPLSILKGGAGGFLEWLFQVTNSVSPDKRIAMQDVLRNINNQWIKTIDDYHFPVVTLSDETKPDALCTIFETLNRTGVKLSVFELLTARFWPDDINLRQLWENAITKHPIVSDYEVDPYYFLQAISLASRTAPSCKRQDILNLEAADITAWWDKVTAGFALALQILRDDCNVVLPKWLPYHTMLTPLAAVLAKIGPVKTAEAGAHREKLKRWFWCSVFGQAYEKAPNSQSATDVMELGNWVAGGKLPEVVSALRFDPNLLRDVTPRQRAIYRGVICLVLGSAGGARDFHTQAVITGNLINQEGIDDHHIFPAHYLEQNGVKHKNVRDCVLNRTLIDRTTNQMISDRAPSKYLADVRNTPGFPFVAILSSHSLPGGADSPLLKDDFDGFLAWRQKQLWKEIQRVTGLKESTNEMADGAAV